MATFQIDKDWRITSDERNWIVQQRRVIKKTDNAENIGKEVWSNDGYFPSVAAAARGLVEKAIKIPNDVQSVISKLDELHHTISHIFDGVSAVCFADEVEETQDIVVDEDDDLLS
jgi:hypothetical protein